MERHLLTHLTDWKNNTKRKPLLLQGARQVGKTHLLKEFGKKEFQKFHYVNFERDPNASKIFEEDLNPQKILAKLSLYFDLSIDKEDLIIFDEIQNCPLALTSLKYFAEDAPEIYLSAAGSLLGITLLQGSFPVGKVDHLYLYPLSFSEFLDAVNPKLAQASRDPDLCASEPIHLKIWNLLKIYFITGGLPEIVSLYQEDPSNTYEVFAKIRSRQHSLIQSYESDIAKHSGKLDAMHIRRVMESVPAQLARTVDTTHKRFIFGGVVPGVKRYAKLAGAIDWLIAAGLILKTRIIETPEQPFIATAKENIFKLYFFDIGILGALSNISPQVILDFSFGTYKGYFAENFIAQELIAYGSKDLFAWSKGTAEIEFILSLGNDSIPIEVKSGSSTKAKSLSVFHERYSPPFGIVLNAKKFSCEKEKKNYHFPLYLVQEMLKKLSSFSSSIK